VVRALESAAQEDGTVRAGSSETRLLITPGFRFRVVERLITNFHLPAPRSSCWWRSRVMRRLWLPIGWRSSCATAYSCGDAMVIL
jgi:hypothetical protein